MEKLKLMLSRQRSGSHILRVLAGGYLVYLAYGIFTDAAGSKPIWVLLCGAVFAVFGLIVALSSLYALCSGHFLEQVQSDEAAAKEAEGEEESEDDSDSEHDS